MKTQDRQSLVCQPPKKAGTQGLRRPRFPFFISQCQRAAGSAASCHLPNPRWKQIPHPESTTAVSVPRRTQALLRFCPRIARSRTVPQEVGTTRAKRSFKQRSPACQGPGNRCPVFSLFLVIVTLGPHSCPNASPLSVSLTARQPYRARYGSREPAEGGYLKD